MELGGDFQAFVDFKTQVMMVDQSFFSGFFFPGKLGDDPFENSSNNYLPHWC